MKRAVFGGMFLALVFVCAQGRGSTKTLQEFQRHIGDDLIGIKKQFPSTQMMVYTILDQLSKYYSFSKNLISKKSKYKKLLKNEIKQNELLKKNIGDMQKKIASMKQVLTLANKKIKSNNFDSQKLKQERDNLAREREKWEIERASLIQERDTLAQERDALVQEREQKANSISAPRSPR